jgi:hypothetical protein
MVQEKGDLGAHVVRGSPVQESRKVTFLRLELNRSLNWSDHVERRLRRR